MIELPNKKPLSQEFERAADDCSERQIAASFIEKIAPEDEKENAKKMADKIRGNEKSSIVAKRYRAYCSETRLIWWLEFSKQLRHPVSQSEQCLPSNDIASMGFCWTVQGTGRNSDAKTTSFLACPLEDLATRRNFSSFSAKQLKKPNCDRSIYTFEPTVSQEKHF